VTLAEVRDFVRAQPWAVEATVSAAGGPQAAVIGVAISDALELVFDTLADSRKFANLERDARVAIVVGWDAARTVQLEGRADRPDGVELARLKATYFARFADGPQREAWAGITYWRVRPTWIRYSDFTVVPPTICLWDRSAIDSFVRAR
jgi:pyridoxine/pyridoxamine 5'-phosphate oxidase